MSQVLHGIAGAVRVVKSSLGIVALVLALCVVFSTVIFLFSPLPNIAKYIVGGLPWILVIAVWLQFWSKAKEGPLVASEIYYREELLYQYMGTQEHPLTLQQMWAQIPRENPLPLQSAQPPEKDECST